MADDENKQDPPPKVENQNEISNAESGDSPFNQSIDVPNSPPQLDLPIPLIAKVIPDSPRKAIRRKQDPIQTERSNLLNVTKLLIKELLDSSLRQGRMLDDSHVPLQQFFVVFEHILRHKLKPKKGILRDKREFWSVLESIERYAPEATKKGILRDKREFWSVLESIERYAPEASEITTSVREMTDIKSPLGRARAWVRLSLMQKTLADYFTILIQTNDILYEFYEEGAILMCDEATVIEGLLVGLNVIDCNLCVKEEDLDQPMGVIDFSLYLKDKNQLQSPDRNEDHVEMAAILDQKNYLEELNRHLNATVTNLQQKNETLQTNNTLLKEDLAISKNTMLRLQEENEILTSEKESLYTEHQRQLARAQIDLDTERETYETSRVGLNDIYSDTKKRLEEETTSRIDVEKELELQISMKQEMEMALRLLEKDIHEKQDSIISLRNQLDDIKSINLQVYNTAQETSNSLRHKTDMVAKLEEKTNQLVGTMKDMEKKLKASETQKDSAVETARQLDARRVATETDLKIEKEWRGTLQKQLEGEKEKVSKMSMDLQRYREVEKDLKSLRTRHLALQDVCKDHEKTLTELGAHLSVSKLKVEDMREETQMQSELSWASDKDANICKQCEKTFSVSRRKHHCRNCGDIYCNECSDNKMPHPSASKPVRVCDRCNTLLLQRYSAN